MDVYNRWAARYVNVPTLVVLAEKDRIIDNAKTRRFVRKFPTSDLTIHEFPDAHHTLEFEPDGPPFVDLVMNWIREHIPDIS
jgi:alpha-beta hydrolase superfamily lysophospholipase